MAKIEFFSPTHRILLYYPEIQKFTLNRSISCGFQDIHTFSFSAKIQDGHQKWQKLKFFTQLIGYSCTTLWVQNSLEIALSLMVFVIFTLFHFPLKSKMAPKIGELGKFFPYSQVLPCGSKIRSKSLYLLRCPMKFFFCLSLYQFLRHRTCTEMVIL